MPLEKDYLSLTQKQKIMSYLQLKISQFMELNEEEVQEIIRSVESDPLFKRLTYPEEDLSMKIISYSRFPYTEIKPNFYELPKNIVRDRGDIDIEEIMLDYEDALKIAKKIGEEDFKKYFLYNDLDTSIKDLAKKWEVTEDEILRVMKLVDEVFLKSKFYSSSLEAGRIRYTKVALIYRERQRFYIGFFDLNLARGVYKIDYEKLSNLKEKGIFSKEELKRINLLISKINLINLRKSIIFKTLSFIINRQKAFLETGELKRLLSLTQKELSKESGTSMSIISRSIRYKSVEVPWREELPLKFFFPTLKEVRMRMLQSLLEEEGELRSDEEIRRHLEKRYGIYLSRRTVSKYRKELNLSPFGRKK